MDSFNQKKTLILASVLLLGLGILAFFLGLKYFQLRNEFIEPPTTGLPPEKEKEYRRVSQVEFSDLEQEINTFSPQPELLKPECFDVPIFNSEPWSGALNVEYPNPNYSDFYYEGNVLDVVERKVNNCIYEVVLMKRFNFNYELYIPKGFKSIQSVGLPAIYPEILKTHTKNRLWLKMRYQRIGEKIKIGEKKTPTLRLLEWEFNAFFID